MTWINTITESANQSVILSLPDGTSMTFTLKYFDGQKGWYFSLVYGNFKLNNRRMVAGANMLRAFKNIIPFGLSCTTTDGYEPIYQSDFVNGRASLYLLNASDVVAVEAIL